MAYRIEQTSEGNALVIDGWEAGIAESPFAGIAKLINANVTDVPGQASVELKPTALTIPPTVSAVAFTSTIADDLITVASTTGWYNGMAIQLNTVVTSTGIATGRVYWVGDLTATTFKVYKNPSREATTVVDIATGDGSGTLSSYTFGQPLDSTYGQSGNKEYQYGFILDDAGRVWWIDNSGGTLTNNLVYLGNDTLTAAATDGRAIAVWKNHLIIFRGDIDGIGLIAIEDDVDFDSAYVNSSSGGWEYAFESLSGTTDGDNPRRRVMVGQDDVLYYDNDTRLGSLSENSGSTLDLDDGASYTKNVAALDFPEEEEGATLPLAELGTWLLIGGKRGRIYPWDRISSSFNIPIEISEKRIHFIVSTGLLAYAFAGDRGRIYVTNGSSVGEFFKIPDHLTGVEKPLFTIKDVAINRNELLFSFTATKNDGTAITGQSLDGVWAINLSTGAFRNIQTSSHATDGTVHTILASPFEDGQEGSGLVVGWEDASSNYGIDVGSSDPCDGGETTIETDIVPVGTFRKKITPGSIEYKLSRPLVSGESIQILQRSNLSASYTSIGTSNTVGLISESMDINFEDIEWIQLKVVLTSTSSSPSYVPLRELRITF